MIPRVVEWLLTAGIVVAGCGLALMWLGRA